MGNPSTKKILRSSKQLAIGVLESVFALAYLLAKQTGRAKTKISAGVARIKYRHHHHLHRDFTKARLLPFRRSTGAAAAAAGCGDDDEAGRGLCHRDEDEDGDEGEGGLWRRTILMGDRCQPLDFSGAIYYDCKGNRVLSFPTATTTNKSPRRSSAFDPPALRYY